MQDKIVGQMNISESPTENAPLNKMSRMKLLQNGKS
jgi:hypothetical protein